MPGSKLPLFHIIGDGHQPNSRGLYTHYKDSYCSGGIFPIPQKKYSDNLDHGTQQIQGKSSKFEGLKRSFVFNQNDFGEKRFRFFFPKMIAVAEGGVYDWILMDGFFLFPRMTWVTSQQ